MKALLQHFTRNKYRLTIFGLLAGASIICVGILRFRASLTGSTNYAFLIWNLFLAWIPLVIAHYAHQPPLAVFYCPFQRHPLADFLPQRALHPDRFSAPEQPRGKHPGLVRCHAADLVFFHRAVPWHGLALHDAGDRTARIRTLVWLGLRAGGSWPLQHWRLRGSFPALEFLGYSRKFQRYGAVRPVLYPQPHTALAHFCRYVRAFLSVRLPAPVHLRPSVA